MIHLSPVRIRVLRPLGIWTVVVVALALAAGLAVQSTAEAKGKVRPQARMAVTTNWYLSLQRHPSYRNYFGPRHTNTSNWMYVADCGGVANDNCSNEWWEFNNNGWEPYHRYGGGKGWFGMDHAPTQLFFPACRVESLSSQEPNVGCYQTYGS